MKAMQGLTLFELLTCLLIGSILLSIGIPSLKSAMQINQQALLVNQLLGSLNFARGSAVTQRATVSICSGVSNCGKSAIWSNQLLIFYDLNKSGQLDAGEHLLRQEYLPPDYVWKWSRSRSVLQFEPDGTTRALNGTLALCRAGQPLKKVVINITGRVRTQNTKPSDSCH